MDYQELLARLRAGTRILELQDSLLNAQKEMEYQATHDSLTGLWNRLAWKRLLAAEFERAHRNATSVAVLMVDVDHFKSVNDTYGHSAGDAVLQRSWRGAAVSGARLRPRRALRRRGIHYPCSGAVAR